MDNTTLITVASIGLICSIVLFVIGLLLIGLCFWKLDIKNVYLIRSGRAKRKTVSQLQAHNAMTGNLRDSLDLDYTTGKLKREGRKSGKTAEKTKEAPFKRAAHSGDTGSFNESSPAEMPAAQQEAVRESERRAETAETSVLTPTPETTQLEEYRADNYSEWIKDAYEDMDEGSEVTQTLYEEVRVPIDIISKELIIHTNEIIEI